MAKKQFVDKDGNKFVEVTPWYKKWWIWVLAVVVILLMIGFLGGSNNNSASKSDRAPKATAHNTTDNEKGSNEQAASDKATASSVTVDDEQYSISGKKVYSVDYSNSSWSPAKVTVDKVTVYKLTKPHKYESANDGTFKTNGYVRLHFIISPTRDIDVYPTQGTAIYDNGEQHGADSMESWDGEVAKGVTKSGNVTLPIQKLENANSLKSVRFKFDADYDTDDDEDENSDHTYDFTINLQN
ncbi:hypothetical protein HC026_05080 [Lactobacillus sp. LC28-10]|uniref:Prophage related protein n=1 Tax=Secundilactobacillus angelensis TaxID=2722706 RepID=A0ABX1KWI9_9LACO|nr:hypothetical protein [Secundilactobacillus angelensis]MCH5462511.1 hypothetical protein [Secundilactobacillus angelensis]NLR18298.1 hypothetical protein [Secundilactobacillus angelensis]